MTSTVALCLFPPSPTSKGRVLNHSEKPKADALAGLRPSFVSTCGAPTKVGTIALGSSSLGRVDPHARRKPAEQGRTGKYSRSRSDTSRRPRVSRLAGAGTGGLPRGRAPGGREGESAKSREGSSDRPPVGRDPRFPITHHPPPTTHHPSPASRNSRRRRDRDWTYIASSVLALGAVTFPREGCARQTAS